MLDGKRRGSYTGVQKLRQPHILMTKRDLVIRISNETGLVQQEVLDVVQKTLDYIAEAVSQGQKGGTPQLRRIRSEGAQSPRRTQSKQPWH